ncbi:glycoside hydrolase family 2 protein [Dysgonomonas sp. BGC7]|uniref:glycoside hydrolase family 2 protein n=1 Tax=Dysgonomonas sp. BGC7 TaxID=1658008 RepID=UPI0006829EE4|nr:glycoside hydrolase family 2 TIM barrel-domain containing protein [Dysgonomonas sp. BGC7]MBD8387294.1 beta galactosidase jelly roll domain-containing protein [Dysgonomonas sp. BGC7]
MKRILFTIFTLLLAATSFAKEIPLVSNIYARENISLNGKWNYVVDPLENGYYGYRLEVLKNGFFKNRKAQNPQELVEYNLDTSPIMDIPSDWNTKDDQLFFYEGTVWFKKDFEVSKEAGKKYVLYFGAANYDTKVYVNGTKVGEHIGGYTPFNFDVTDEITNGNNFVVVKVDNKRHKDNVPTVNMDWWNYGGITREVMLSVLPETYLEDYFIQLPKGVTNLITGWVKLNNPLAGQTITIDIPELKIKQKLLTDTDGKAVFEIKSKPVLWTPENPKLYDVALHSENENISDKIGFRTIETKEKQILLNGQHIFLRGISIHEEAPFYQGRAWSKEHAVTLLSWAKEMGCNYVRLAHYPHNENMVREAERLGLMVWSEIPVYWTISFDREETYQNAQNQLRDMIYRDKNRAAVIIWSIANETPHGDARDKFLSRLSSFARQQDNTRLISMAMEVTEAPNNINKLDDNMNEFVDVVSFNQYLGWYRGTNESCKDMKWEVPYNKPVIISEFGGDALQGMHGPKTQRWTEEYQEELYIQNLEMLDKIEGLSGLSPWILVDFRSPRRQLPGIQDFYNRKGVISNWGIKKKAFFVMQDFYNKKKEEYKTK